MTRPVQKDDGIYDLVTCVGTFTKGHVGPGPGIRELARLTKNHGAIIITVLEEFWEAAIFSAEVEKLVAEKLLVVVATELINYIKASVVRQRWSS